MPSHLKNQQPVGRRKMGSNCYVVLVEEGGGENKVDGREGGRGWRGETREVHIT